jgi:transcription elongation factor GreA-like protein
MLNFDYFNNILLRMTRSILEEDKNNALCRRLVILAQIFSDNNKNSNVETLCLSVSDVRGTKTAEYSIKCLIQVTRFATQEVGWRCLRAE